MSEADGGGFDGASGGASAAGPFSPSLNAALGDAFGESLAGISVTRGVDTELASIHADASTSGRTIGLASNIREDLSDPYSMEVIGHEVAHALAGGGSGQTLIDRPGDPGEHAADAAGRAFAHFAEDPSMASPALRPAYGGCAAVHRHEIEGPWNWNDPIHETMTAESLKRAGLISKNASYSSNETWEFTRGAMWNDDPSHQLFDDNSPMQTSNYSAGKEWYGDFSAGEKEAAAGKKFGPGDPLLKRSHYGDMQFLHGMAPDDEDPAVTKQKMLMWAELTTSIAEGKIDGSAQLGELALKNPQFKAMLGGDKKLAGMNVNALFGVQDPGVEDNQAMMSRPLQEAKPGEMSMLQKRALGSLLHMVQDSYAEGHVEREDLGGGRMGKITNFHAYGNQSHDAHAAADGAPGPPQASLMDKINAKPGGEDSIAQGAVIASMIKRGVPVEKVLSYLDTNTFATADGIGPAGPGEKFKKPPPPPPAPPMPPMERGPRY